MKSRVLTIKTFTLISAMLCAVLLTEVKQTNATEYECHIWTYVPTSTTLAYTANVTSLALYTPTMSGDTPSWDGPTWVNGSLADPYYYKQLTIRVYKKEVGVSLWYWESSTKNVSLSVYESISLDYPANTEMPWYPSTGNPFYSTTECSDLQDQCEDERVLAAAACIDEDHYVMDEDTCEWSCLPTDNCMEEYNALVATCGDAGIKNWNNTTCWGECDNPCNKEDPCPDIVQEFIEQCGGEDMVETITCDADFDTDGCLVSVNSYKLCKDSPENCDQYRNFVNETCGGSQYVAAYYCNEYDFDNKFYECSSPTIPEDDPPDPGEPEPTDDPEDPDTDDPQDEPDPESTDSETLKDIEKNTRSTVKNTQEIAEQQAETNQTLDWIGDNTKIIADNTAKIEESIDDLAENLDEYMGNDKILDELEEIGEGIEDLEDAIQGETGPVADLNTTGPGEYEVEEHDFGSRTSQFFDEMKTTGLFAVPTSFFASIPSGGTSQFVIDGGDTFGTHTLDFSDYSTGLLALRAVIQIAFMWLAIRIVTLKR